MPPAQALRDDMSSKESLDEPIQEIEIENEILLLSSLTAFQLNRFWRAGQKKKLPLNRVRYHVILKVILYNYLIETIDGMNAVV